MSRFDRYSLWNIDWFLFASTMVICAIGVATIYSAISFSSERPYHIRQIYYIAIGLFAMLAVIVIDYRRFLSVQRFIYWGSILLLVYLLIRGGVGGKVDRYLKIWIFPTITPSEFIKFALILQFAHRFQGQKLGNLRLVDLLGVSLGFALALALIVKQPDLGTAVLLCPVFLLLVFVSGLDPKKLIAIMLVLAVIGGVSAKYVLKPYQYERLTGFMKQTKDVKSSNWQLRQSKVAIGSGGFWGRGYLRGTQAKLEFLPAKHTDFILAVFAEEWGFIGLFTLFSLYVFWFWRAFRIARFAVDAAGLLLAVGVCGLVVTQFLFNAGMIVGLLPITGLTLPFMSYGGSSIIVNMTCVGMLISIGMRRM